MGLADRFKEKLEKRDIFQKSEIDYTLENNNIKFISKPIENSEDECNIEHNSTQEIVSSQSKPNLEDLETEIISKIRKTPYWEEFSNTRQKNMITSYFELKIKSRSLDITKSEKLEFINNILALSNNR